MAEHYSGNIGGNSILIKYELKKGGISQEKAAKVSADELKSYVFSIKDRWHSMEFLAWSDKKRYGTLLDNFENNFTTGTNQYPCTLISAYHMTIEYKNSVIKDTSSKNQMRIEMTKRMNAFLYRMLRMRIHVHT